MNHPQIARPMATVAMGSAAAIMAYQVALRATRDTLFLSNFHVRSLPLMVTAAGVLSIVAALFAARAIVAYGPARFVPAAFLASALLTLGEWGLVLRQPGVGAVVVYLHVAAITPLLLSGFWSILIEDIDARSAKRSVGRIAAIGTLGGLLGGLLAERLTAWTGAATVLPALALLQLVCALATRLLPSRAAGEAAETRSLSAAEAARRLVARPYLRNVALLVLGSSVAATLLDFVFKAQAFELARQSLDLMRVFSIFYALVSIVTFVVQALLTRPALERAGVAATIGTLPASLVLGGVAAALVPGAVSVGIARGLEGALRGSLFRAGYDVLFTAIPAAEKRATRALVDVGCDRLGDIVGAGIIALVLLAGPERANLLLLACCVGLALATLLLVGQLRRGYVASLEQGLREGGIDASATRTAEMTTLLGLVRPTDAGLPGLAAEDVPALLAHLAADDPARARAALHAASPLDPALVPQAIRLLARAELARDAAGALRLVAAQHVGQLTDTLLDPASDVLVRSRVAGLLAACPSPRAVDGLLSGLADERFDVRFACGRALAKLARRADAPPVDAARVEAAVVREAAHERAIWQSQRLLERLHEEGDDGRVDAFLRARAGRSLEHVFTLLALMLPPEPLRIAFRGLLTGDPMLRGTALEYLEHVLPEPVRVVLWPHLEPEAPPSPARAAPPANREQVLSELLRSNASIEISLEALRREPPTAAPDSR